MEVVLSVMVPAAAQNALAGQIECSGQVDTLAYHVSGTADNAALMAGI